MLRCKVIIATFLINGLDKYVCTLDIVKKSALLYFGLEKCMIYGLDRMW
jgi:hypothetical protein